MNESEYFHIPLHVDLPHLAERVAFSPDGRWLAVGAGWRLFGANEGGLSIVDGNSGEIVWTTADLKNCLDLTFTPDAQRLAVSVLDQNNGMRIQLLRVSNGEKLWEVPGAGFLAFSPDATLLGVDGVSEPGEAPHSFVLAADSGTLLHKQGSSMAVPGFTADSRLMCTGCPSLVEASTGTLRWTEGDHENVASAAVFTDDDDAVLFATAPEATIFVFQLEPGPDGSAVVRSVVDAPELFSADQWIGAISFSPGHGMILQLSQQELVLISVIDGSVLHRFPKTRPAINIAAAFRANDKQLVLNIPVPPAPPDMSGAGISVVDTRTGATLWSDPGLECVDLALSADGARLAAVGETSLLVYELGLPARSRHDCRAPVSAVATSAAAAGIVAAAADNNLIVFRAATGEAMLERDHPGTIGDVAVSPDGHSVVTASSDGRCRHFDTLTGDRWTGKHNAPVNAVAFSDDSKRVATASADRTARLFDRTPGANPDDQTALWSHQHPQGVSHVVLGPAAAWLATACLDRKVRILSGSTGDELHSPFEHDGKIRALAVAGTTLVTASDDGSALVIDAVSGQRRFRLEHPGKVTAAEVSPDAALLATAGTGNDCHLWRIDGAQPVLLHRLATRAVVNDLAFGADGQLAIATEHQVVAIVDPGTGREIERLIHPKAVSHLASGIDRSVLATACADNVARVYEMREE